MTSPGRSTSPRRSRAMPWRTQGGLFWPFSLATMRKPFVAAKHFSAERVPFAAVKGLVNAKISGFLLFSFFLQNPQNSKHIMGITPNDIPIPSYTNHEKNPWMDYDFTNPNIKYNFLGFSYIPQITWNSLP